MLGKGSGKTTSLLRSWFSGSSMKHTGWKFTGWTDRRTKPWGQCLTLPPSGLPAPVRLEGSFRSHPLQILVHRVESPSQLRAGPNPLWVSLGVHGHSRFLQIAGEAEVC